MEKGRKEGKSQEQLDIDWKKNIESMTDTFMLNFEEFSITAGQILRDGVINGMTEGVDRSITILNSLSTVLKDMAYNANSILSDIMFGGIYEKVETITKNFLERLANIKEADKVYKKEKVVTEIDSPKYGGKVTQTVEIDVEITKEEAIKQAIDGMVYDIVETVKPLLDATETLPDPIALAGKALIKQGYDIIKVADSLGVSIEDLGYTQEEVFKMWTNGEIKGSFDDVSKHFSDKVKDMYETLKETFSSGNLTGIFENFSKAIDEGLVADIDFDSVFKNFNKKTKNVSDSTLTLINAGQYNTAARATKNLADTFTDLTEVETNGMEVRAKYSGEEIRSRLKVLGLSKEEEDALYNIIRYKQEVNVLNAEEIKQEEVKNGLISALKDSLKESTYTAGLENLGEYFSTTIVDNMVDSLIPNMYKAQIESMEKVLVDNLTKNFDIAMIQRAGSELQYINASFEKERAKLNTIRDMLSFNNEVEYMNTDNKIEYKTGSTQSIVNNYYNTVKVDVGTFFGNNDEAMYDLADKLFVPLEQISKKR